MITKNNLLQDAIDLHVHSGPGLISRSVDHVTTCIEAAQAGMKAVVLKDQHWSTANQVHLLRDHILKDLPIEIYGGHVLNNAAGGLNPYVVDAAIQYGSKIVWMPTLSAENHKVMHEKMSAEKKAAMPKVKSKLYGDPPITILDQKGEILPEVLEICRLIAKAGIVLATGHLSKKEVGVLIAHARKEGVKKILINHPEHLLGATIDDMAAYAEQGMFLEHSYSLVFSNKLTDEYLFEMIRTVGAEYSIVASDLGQLGRPHPVEGLRIFTERMLEFGLTRHEIRLVLCENPSKLLGI